MASITITKVTDPPGVLDSFFFEPNSFDPGFGLSDGGSMVYNGVLPGTFTFTEADPTFQGFALTDISCNDGMSANPSVGDLGTRTATINLDPAEDVICTFTNSDVRGSITITKVTDPIGVADSFFFEPNSFDPGFGLFDGGSMVYNGVLPGTFTFTEADPTFLGFVVTDISCNDGLSASPSVGDVGSRTVTINLDPAEDVICTFTNSDRLTAVQSGIDALEAKLDNLNLSGLGGASQASVDIIEGKLDVIETKLDNLDISAQITADVAVVQAGVDTLEGKLDVIETKLDNLDVSTALTADVAAVQASVDALESKLDAIEVKLDQVDTDLGDPNTGLGAIAGRLDDPNTGLGAIRATVDQAVVDIELIELSLSSIDPIVVDTNTRTRTVETEMVALQLRSIDTNAIVTDVQARVGTIETEMVALQLRSIDTNAIVTDVQARVGTIETEMVALQLHCS